MVAKKSLLLILIYCQIAQAATTTEPVIPGVVHQQITQVGPNLVINILFVDPLLTNIQLIHATSSGTNTELVPSIGSRSHTTINIPAVAAINGIYFRRCGRFNGNPLRIVVYCANYMCPKSKKAWYMLQALGFTNVKAYEGGIREWSQLGLPSEGACSDPHLKDQTQKPTPDPKVTTISAQELAAKIKQNN